MSSLVSELLAQARECVRSGEAQLVQPRSQSRQRPGCGVLKAMAAMTPGRRKNVHARGGEGADIPIDAQSRCCWWCHCSASWTAGSFITREKLGVPGEITHPKLRHPLPFQDSPCLI